MEEKVAKSPFARIVERLREINERLTNVQKMAVSALMIALVLGVALAVWFANDREYATLYSDLDEQQAGRVTEELKKRNVEYQIGLGGTTVMVPSDQVYELRLQLASTGVTGGSNVGYELIDQNKFFGMPEDVLEVTKRRMLEGELARSVSSLTEVSAARVHLATPKKTLFVEDQRPPSASVIVQLERGGTLTNYQVKGVVNLVSGAVAGLDPEGVTVVDQRGKVLNRKTPDSVEGGTTFEYQQTLERTLEQKATEVLERIVGSGRAVVRVRATLDFSREERTEELYNPEGQVVRSEESLNEVRQNGGNRVGGGAGANANDPNVAQGVVRVGDASNANREKVITNYEINKVVKRVKGPSAKIKRLSIAVLVANKVVTPTPKDGDKAEDAVPQPQSVARTKEELAAFEQLVKQAVGFHATEIRKDIITVQNVEFTDEDTKLAEAQLRAAELREAVRFWTRMGIVLVVALLLVFLVFRPMVRTLTEQPELAEVLDGQLPKSEESALPGDEIFDESEYEMVPISDKLVAYCKANPQTAADVLTHWLRSETKSQSMRTEIQELEESAA
jgi:flagellar M-ring protein FliF